MATSVKLAQPTKQELDRLQAEYVVRTGRKISQQDLMEILIRRGRDQLAEIADEMPRWTRAEWKRLMSLGVHMGVRTREEDIDQVLYGADP